MKRMKNTLTLKGEKLVWVTTHLIKLVRWPNLLMVFFTQYVVFVFIVEKKSSDIGFWLPPHEFYLLTLGTVLVAAAGYIINDYYDIKIDLVNKPRRIVIGSIISRRQALFLHSLITSLALCVGFLLSWRVACFFAACAFFLWIYSNSLKRTPFLGNLLVSLLTAATIWVVGLYFRENNRIVYVYTVFAFYISLLREIIKDMEDTKGDSVYGCKTLPIVLGFRRTKIVLLVLLFFFTFLIANYAQMATTALQSVIYYAFVFPILFLAYKILRADRQKDYAQLSMFCKWLMLAGVLSLGFA